MNMYKGLVLLAVAGFLFMLGSCSSKKSYAPKVYLVDGTGYVSKDTALAHGTAFTIWVYSTKEGVDDLLNTGQITKSVNGAPDSVLQSMSFIRSYFSQTYSYVAGDSGKTEKYTFTFGNDKGLTKDTSVVITCI